MLDFGAVSKTRGWVWQFSSMHCDSIHGPYWANCQGKKFHQFTRFPGNLWLGVERWKPHLWECCFNIVQGPNCKFHLIISLKILLVTFSFLSASLAIIGQLDNDFIQHLSFSISWSILPSIPPEGFVRIYVALSWYFVIIPIRQAGMEPLKFQHLEIILLPANYQLVYWSVSSYVTNKSSWWLTKITSPKNSKLSPSSRKKSPGRRDYIHQPRALWHASDLPEAAQVKSDDSNCSSFTNRWFWQKFSSVDVGVCFFGVDQDFSN